jgi:ferredoxin--NADP+ reductase
MEERLTNIRQNSHPVAIIGAGPAGLYAAKFLAAQGAHIALINRDIKPGGLAEYGIFHNKHRTKNALRKQFYDLMESPCIFYYGNVVVGEEGDISLDELRGLGFQSIMVTTGAQGTKWLGIPGEEYKGVYHAKDLVYSYNMLPPFDQEKYPIGDKVVVIGMGNVMINIVNYCVNDLQVKEVTTIGRRGPADVKFSRKEMAYIINNLDRQAFDAEIARTAPILERCGQDPEAAREFILSASKKAVKSFSDTRFQIEFLSSPKAILGGKDGWVTGIEVEDNTLELRDSGETKAVPLGTTRVIPCDTVIFCIGDRVDPGFGLPLDQWNNYAINPKPEYPVDGISFEAYDPGTGESIEGIFLAGWAREASLGLVGKARRDGEYGAKALLQYLEELQPSDSPMGSIEALESRLSRLNKPVVLKSDWRNLVKVEQKIAKEQSLDEFKYASNEEMLDAMGLIEKA